MNASEHKVIRPRTAARLCAVQALYQMEMSGGSAEHTITQFLDYRIGEVVDGFDCRKTDTAMFGRIVRGAKLNQQQLDELIAGSLTEDWTLARLDKILRVTLRAGAYELLYAPDVPVRVILNEYVDIAHSFFEGAEPGLLNGILDRIGHLLRADELEHQSERATPQ